MATHSTILAWEIPWTEKPRGLQSMGLQRVGHDLVELVVVSELNYQYLASLFGEGNGTPLQYSCLENPMDGGAW